MRRYRQRVMPVRDWAHECRGFDRRMEKRDPHSAHIMQRWQGMSVPITNSQLKYLARRLELSRSAWLGLSAASEGRFRTTSDHGHVRVKRCLWSSYNHSSSAESDQRHEADMRRGRLSGSLSFRGVCFTRNSMMTDAERTGVQSKYSTWPSLRLLCVYFRSVTIVDRTEWDPSKL